MRFPKSMKISDSCCEIRGITKSLPIMFFDVESGLDIIEAGALFSESAELLTPSEWEKWINEEVGCSVYMANHYIETAKLCLLLPSLMNMPADIVFVISGLPEIEIEKLRNRVQYRLSKVCR